MERTYTSKIINTKIMERISLYVIIAILSILLLKNCGKTEKTNSKQTKTIEISQKNGSFLENEPKEIVKYDTVVVNKERTKVVKEIVRIENPVNIDLLCKYKLAIAENDSLKQLELYKEAIEERKYSQVFQDSVQTITAEIETIGSLKNLRIDYSIKPIKIEVKEEMPALYGGIYTTFFNKVPSVGCKLDLINRKKMFTLGYDSDKFIFAGLSFKLSK